MVGMTSSVLRGRAWTGADLAELPEDGHRYEVLDGALVVTPAPLAAHQQALTGIFRQLLADGAPDLTVLVAPLDVTLDDRTVVQPDLLVARRAQIERRGLRGRPELAVEILSPGSQVVDRNLKFDGTSGRGLPHTGWPIPTN